LILSPWPVGGTGRSTSRFGVACCKLSAARSLFLGVRIVTTGCTAAATQHVGSPSQTRRILPHVGIHIISDHQFVKVVTSTSFSLATRSFFVSSLLAGTSHPLRPLFPPPISASSLSLLFMASSPLEKASPCHSYSGARDILSCSESERTMPTMLRWRHALSARECAPKVIQPWSAERAAGPES